MTIKKFLPLYVIIIICIANTLVIIAQDVSPFQFTDLNINPTEANAGDLITITFKITNIKNVTDIAPINLFVDGWVKFGQNVTLDGSKSRILTYKFRVQDELASYGQHIIEVENLKSYYNISFFTLNNIIYYGAIIIVLSIIPMIIIILKIREHKMKIIK